MRHIELTNGGCTTVSDIDYQKLCEHRWHSIRNKRNIYVRAWICQKKILMHRFILDAKKGEQVDHKNGNGLDNTRENIRICSSQENAMNRRIQTHSSKYKGVRWHDNGKWVARIKISGKLKHIGCFSSEEGAAAAYNVAAVSLFGEFAKLNEIGG